MSKRYSGSYHGGGNLGIFSAVGYITRSSTAKRKRTDYQKLDKQIKAEKKALRKYEITKTDEMQLGLFTSGWGQYIEVLRDELKIMKKISMNKADRISHVWNKKGFKTASNNNWTPRLVNIAKDIVSNRYLNKRNS